MLRPVVGRVPDDGVLLESVLLQEVEYQPDIMVVLQHATAVIVLIVRVLCGLGAPLVVDTRVEMHAAGV
jgi:hypothetical protein